MANGTIPSHQTIKKLHNLFSNNSLIDHVEINPKKNPADIAMDDKIKDFSQISKTIQQYDERIKSCTVDYLDLTGSNFFVNSEGTHIQQDKLSVWSRITASAESQDVFTFSREEIGSTLGYEIFDTQSPQEIGETVAKRAVAQLSAKQLKGDKLPVVLSPNVVGVFVHEAFGHLAEADLALSDGILSNTLGKRLVQTW